jgi:hypothetical protein
LAEFPFMVKNPVLPHRGSSEENASFTLGFCAFKLWGPFIPALPNAAFWLFHVGEKAENK